MNVRRILSGGLAAGVFMVVLNGFIRNVWLAREFADAYAALGLPRESPIASRYWVGFDLLMGFAMAWLYAAMRPRFGPGLKTALYAGFFDWITVQAVLLSHLADRVFPPELLIRAGAGGLVVALLGAYLAGWLYSEA